MNRPAVRYLHEVDDTQIAVVGGKGAHLGELSRIEGISVPPGFCVTTHAFRRVVIEEPCVGDKLDQLTRLDTEEPEATRTLSAELRTTIEQITIPADLVAEIDRAVAQLGERAAYAVRSSATAEDLPAASFAGQHDSYLDVVGSAAVLDYVRRCWASLYTDRAVTYRQLAGIDHRAVQMAVLIQQMVVPRAAGVMFTADPLTSDRTVISIEAGFGLGEALVSGRVNGDGYRVRDGELVAHALGRRIAAPTGGTTPRTLEPEWRDQPTLTDQQVLRLAQLGRRIEAHFGRPQDIEWCLADHSFQFVQSRPITTLFPVPEPRDGQTHVYVSVGHQQMMTDPMKPLGLSFWQLATPAPMAEAGGRLFVDVTQRLAAPSSRAGLLDALGRSDPLTGDALQTLLDRDGFIRALPGEAEPGPLFGATPDPIETDPAIVTDLIERSRASIAAADLELRTKTGPALFDFIRADMQELKRVLFDPLGHQVFMSAMEASGWLNDRLQAWLGEKNAADALTRSVPDNVTSEMGLALLGVADAIRPHPEVVTFLQHVRADSFLDDLPELPGGPEAREAIEAWLDQYGMRCAGEIDITRPRWSERPATLVPLLLGHIEDAAPGEAARRFEQGRRRAEAKEQDVLARLRQLPGGKQKAAETKAMIDRVRTFIGYREYPKYGKVCRYFLYKQALLREADRLVQSRVLRAREDIYFLRFSELEDVVRTNRADHDLIARRRSAFRSYEALTPPRVLTSDGEALNGAYRRGDAPTGALVGLPVSAGVVEGRARVVLDLAQADLGAGDILVTTYTDPSWTPAFVAISGLVTEVGGLMTHGAVIAREYGLPAVVGVVDATRLITDGQRIRLHATDGYVETLP